MNCTSPSKKYFLGIIAGLCLMMIFLVPIGLGYGWNAYQSQIPTVTGLTAPITRASNGEVSMEHFGTGVIEVGLSARIGEYFSKKVMPHWNPHQGLGQPFAAMGEGNPYFPARLIRGIIPYSYENFVTIFVLLISSVSMFSLLKVLNITFFPAIVASAIWLTSGSLSMHIARPSLFDQVAMLPVLFAGLALAIKKSNAWFMIAGIFCVAIFLLAGFPQIAAIGMVSAALFIFIFSYSIGINQHAKFRLASKGFLVFLLGCGIASFYLAPLVEMVLTSRESRSSAHGFLPMPLANLVSFFFPLLAGQPKQNWMPGQWPDVTDWNNLYGNSSTLTLLLLIFGPFLTRKMPESKKVFFFFFFILGIVFFLKYISLPPFSLFNYLPVIGTVTPKHFNGITTFLFTIAAAFSLDALHLKTLRREKYISISLLITAFVVMGITAYKVRLLGSFDIPLALVSISLSLIMFFSAYWFVCYASNSNGLNSWRVAIPLLCVVAAEGVGYVLLGNATIPFIVFRGAVVLLILLAGYYIAINQHKVSIIFFISSLIAYVGLISIPNQGLPKRVDLRHSEPYMSFLAARDTESFRTFGINADFSSIGKLNDLSVAGPFSPKSFQQFAFLVSDLEMENFFKSSAKFWLDRGNTSSHHTSIEQYLRMKPLYDWVGVKYLILANNEFSQERRPGELNLLLNKNSGGKFIYQDSQVRIFESDATRTKLEFYPSIRNYKDDLELRNELKITPALIDTWAYVKEVIPNENKFLGPPVSKQISIDEPNRLQANIQVSGPGLLVIKNAYTEGWAVKVNSIYKSLTPVAGILQGIYLPQAGNYNIELEYTPPGWTLGISLTFLSIVICIGLLFSYYFFRYKSTSKLDKESAHK
jgi:hypothetical protein